VQEELPAGDHELIGGAERRADGRLRTQVGSAPGLFSTKLTMDVGTLVKQHAGSAEPVPSPTTGEPSVYIPGFKRTWQLRTRAG
jgi:hypothetical protein